MMDFMEAVKLMKEGKKVRRKGWATEEAYWIITSIGLDTHLTNNSIYHYEATDWEIYKEDDWNLAEQGETRAYPKDIIDKMPRFPAKEIKTFIQKVKEDIDNRFKDAISLGNEINKIIDKRAGKL